MTKVLVMDSAKKLNFPFSKYRILKYYCPQMIFHKRNLDYNNNCKYIFGTFVQAHNKPNPQNNKTAHTLDNIHLRYTNNHQSGHIIHLLTNKFIIQHNITTLPITKYIINHVMATSENMPHGFKITNQDNSTLYNLTLIAGVDYNKDHQDNNHQDDQENTTNNDSDRKTDKHDKMHPDNIAGLAQKNPECPLTNKNNSEANNPVEEEILEEIQEREEDKEEEYKEPFNC
jgi:hypothetical protein